MSQITACPHRRYNPLQDEWVLVSPHRSQRPWQGQTESISIDRQPTFDAQCYLCPGNKRANGEINPKYNSVYLFENDFPALLSDTSSATDQPSALFQQQNVTGCCQVICYTPDHSKSMPDLSINEMQAVIKSWQQSFAVLSKKHAWVQIFENKGAAMGCSNPHPHGQIWATSYIPTLVMQEDRAQNHYYQEYKRPLLLDYAHQEYEQQERVILENHDWIVVVPYWAKWPFETLVLPRFPCPNWQAISATNVDTLGAILQQLTRGYDQLFQCSFPYSMGWHCAPPHQSMTPWQLHAHFLPPLLRNAQIKKFMVGFEMLAETQRDITPEQAAAYLRACM